MSNLYLNSQYNTELDSLDVDRITPLYASDAVLQLSKDRAIEGRDAIRAFFKENFQAFESQSHVAESVGECQVIVSILIWSTDLAGSTISVELQVFYNIKGDPEDGALHNPSFLVIRLMSEGEEKGLIQYMEAKHDLSPIFERIKAGQGVSCHEE